MKCLLGNDLFVDQRRHARSTLRFKKCVKRCLSFYMNEMLKRVLNEVVLMADLLRFAINIHSSWLIWIR